MTTAYKCATTLQGRIVIVKLLIPDDALTTLGRPGVVNSWFAKFRCNKAMVLSITNMDGTGSHMEAASTFVPEFKYRVGETLKVGDYDPDAKKIFAPGIHFFLCKEAAMSLYGFLDVTWNDDGKLHRVRFKGPTGEFSLVYFGSNAAYTCPVNGTITLHTEWPEPEPVPVPVPVPQPQLQPDLELKVIGGCALVIAACACVCACALRS